jgi:hypothetical protein
MKKNHLKGLFCVIITCYISYSYSQTDIHKNVINSPKIQQNKNVLVSKDTSNLNHGNKKISKYPITISKRVGEEKVVHDEEYLTKEIIRIENHIKAIDFKIENVSSDITKKTKAEKDGWFDQMNKIKFSLLEKKIKLELELKSINN